MEDTNERDPAHPVGFANYGLVLIYAFRDETDKAFRWIDVAIENGDLDLSEVHINIQLSNLHDDPRWAPLLEQLGKSPEQLASIKCQVTLLE
jgi:hypothetical protein